MLFYRLKSYILRYCLAYAISNGGDAKWRPIPLFGSSTVEVSIDPKRWASTGAPFPSLRPPWVPGAPVAAPPLLELGVDGAIGEEDVVEEARERTREAELEHGVDGWGGEQRAHEYKGIDCHGGRGWVDQDLGWGNRWWRLDGSREEAQWKLDGSSMPWPRERHERER
jgi:hypothetical protein